MIKLLILSKSDFHSTFRDPFFKLLLALPVLVFGVVFWLVPYLCTKYAVVIPYKQVILMWSCTQAAVMFGMIYGFLFLEEKEAHVWQAIRVLPVSIAQLLVSRLLIGMVISFIVNFILIHFGELITITWQQEVMLALHFSLVAPLFALALGALANNRIEGMAQGKILNLAFTIPALIYFIPQKVIHLTAVIPVYWSFRSMEIAEKGDEGFIFFWLVGLALYGSFIALLNWRMGKV